MTAPSAQLASRQWQVHTRAEWAIENACAILDSCFAYFIIMYILILIRIYCSIFGRAVSGGSHYPTETQSQALSVSVSVSMRCDAMRWDGMRWNRMNPRSARPQRCSPVSCWLSVPANREIGFTRWAVGGGWWEEGGGYAFHCSTKLNVE